MASVSSLSSSHRERLMQKVNGIPDLSSCTKSRKVLSFTSMITPFKGIQSPNRIWGGREEGCRNLLLFIQHASSGFAAMNSVFGKVPFPKLDLTSFLWWPGRSPTETVYQRLYSSSKERWVFCISTKILPLRATVKSSTPILVQMHEPFALTSPIL